MSLGLVGRCIVLCVLKRELASIAHPDVDHVPPAVLDLAVVLHMELNRIFANTVQRDLQARRDLIQKRMRDHVGR